MQLKVVNTLKLTFIVNKINTSIGPILGQYNINIMGFSNEIKQLTTNLLTNSEVPVIILVYNNKEYSYILKKPAISFFLKRLSIFNKEYNNKYEDLDEEFKTLEVLSIKQLYSISQYYQNKFQLNLKLIYKALLSSIKSSQIIIFL